MNPTSFLILAAILSIIALICLFSPNAVYFIHQKWFEWRKDKPLVYTNPDKTLLTPEHFIELGFEEAEDSNLTTFNQVLEHKERYGITQYKAIHVIHKGSGEYYLFIQHGNTEDRTKDASVSISRNLRYKEDLEEFIRIIKL